MAYGWGKRIHIFSFLLRSLSVCSSLVIMYDCERNANTVENAEVKLKVKSMLYRFVSLFFYYIFQVKFKTG